MRHPFQYGAELKLGQIVNRKQELRNVQRSILEDGRLFLLGPRRHNGMVLRPSISYDSSDNSWNGSLDSVKRGEANHAPLLSEAIDGLARLAADAKRPTALVIDEFHKVIQLGGEGAEAPMRAAAQRNTDIGFIFAGSKTTLLNDMTLNPARPFYRIGIRHFFEPSAAR